MKEVIRKWSFPEINFKKRKKKWDFLYGVFPGIRLLKYLGQEIRVTRVSRQPPKHQYDSITQGSEHFYQQPNFDIDSPHPFPFLRNIFSNVQGGEKPAKPIFFIFISPVGKHSFFPRSSQPMRIIKKKKHTHGRVRFHPYVFNQVTYRDRKT